MKEHIKQSHNIWREMVRHGDLVIDATCGNGYDTVVLAQLALTPQEGLLYAFDIQNTAIKNTLNLLKNSFSPEILKQIILSNSCHSEFPKTINKESVKLIVYNLGYLPGENKMIRTRIETTMSSVLQGMQLIVKQGMISIMCYPGHAEGKIEEQYLLSFTSQLSPHQWEVKHQRWIDRETAPSLLIIKKL